VSGPPCRHIDCNHIGRKFHLVTFTPWRCRHRNVPDVEMNAPPGSAAFGLHGGGQQAIGSEGTCRGGLERACAIGL